MKKTDKKAIASIVIAGIVLLFIVFVNRAAAPIFEDGPPLSDIPATTTTEWHIPSPVGEPEEAARNFMLAIGNSTNIGGQTFTLKSIEDSRCPSGVVCIWAGEVKAYIHVERGSEKKDITLSFPGAAVSIDDQSIRITDVSPSEPGSNKALYKVHFEILQ